MRTAMKSDDNAGVPRPAYRALRWGAFGAIVGAICAAIYGAAFGEIEILVVHPPWRLLTVVGYFAICGFVAGAMVGAMAGIFDGHLGRTASKLPEQGTRTNDRRDQGKP